MRIVLIHLLATWALLFGAASASAYAIYFDIGGSVLLAPDISQVTVDVLLDVDPGEAGLELLSVAVISTGGTTYDGSASSNPTYILYTFAGGSKTPSVYMVPTQTPMQTWPGILRPGVVEQVNVNYHEANLDTTRATGNGILLATLVFDVHGTNGSLELSLNEGGNIFRVNGSDIKDTVQLGPGITLIPEPTTALLLALGMVGVGIARRRRTA